MFAKTDAPVFAYVAIAWGLPAQLPKTQLLLNWLLIIEATGVLSERTAHYLFIDGLLGVLTYVNLGASYRRHLRRRTGYRRFFAVARPTRMTPHYRKGELDGLYGQLHIIIPYWWHYHLCVASGF